MKSPRIMSKVITGIISGVLVLSSASIAYAAPLNDNANVNGVINSQLGIGQVKNEAKVFKFKDSSTLQRTYSNEINKTEGGINYSKSDESLENITFQDSNLSTDDLEDLLDEQATAGIITEDEEADILKYFKANESKTIETIFDNLVLKEVITQREKDILKAAVIKSIRTSQTTSSDDSTFNTDQIEKILDAQVAAGVITEDEEEDVLDYLEDSESETIEAAFDELMADDVITQSEANILQSAILKGVRTSSVNSSVGTAWTQMNVNVSNSGMNWMFNK